MIVKKEGFTLVELLIVIAIIGILVAMAIIAIDPIRVLQDTRDTKTRTEMNQVKTSLQLYFNENNSYPATLAGLVPTYTRQLPTFAISYGESGTDYDAAATVNNTTTEDTNSETKCTADGGNGASGDYWICPD